MPNWVHEASKTWGENTAQYQVRVLGQFPTQADDTLIPLTSIEAALSSTPDPTRGHRTLDCVVYLLSDAGCFVNDEQDVRFVEALESVR